MATSECIGDEKTKNETLFSTFTFENFSSLTDQSFWQIAVNPRKTKEIKKRESNNDTICTKLSNQD